MWDRSRSGEMAEALGLGEGAVKIALANMEATGNVLRGRFTPWRGEEEFCDRRILARIHRSTIAGLRKQVEPVSAATFIRFLVEWQHCSAGSRTMGVGGLLDVIEQMQGFRDRGRRLGIGHSPLARRGVQPVVA